MKVRAVHKPTEVEAELFDGQYMPDGVYPDNERMGRYLIKTIEGVMEVTPGSYVVTDLSGNGEVWVVRGDLFDARYERT